jgi:hypothetical protein
MKGFIAPIAIVGLIVIGIVLVISLPSPIYGYILIGTTIIASMSIFIGLRIRQEHREQQKAAVMTSVLVI